MGITIGENQARKLLETEKMQAKDLLEDPGRVEELLCRMEKYLQEMPSVNESFPEIPEKVQEIRAYYAGEEPFRDPEEIHNLTAAFSYFVKREDLVPDHLPKIGTADDMAVLELVLRK